MLHASHRKIDNNTTDSSYRVHRYTLAPYFDDEAVTYNEERDLGVLFTTDAKFSRHVNNIILKANKPLALIRRTFYSLNPHLFRISYVSLVRMTST